MHVTMVKKKLADGSDCRKCADVTAYLQTRGFWDRVDEVVWAYENDPASPGMLLGKRLGVSRSRLYAAALAEYVAKHQTRKITARLNEVYAAEESGLKLEHEDVPHDRVFFIAVEVVLPALVERDDVRAKARRLR